MKTEWLDEVIAPPSIRQQWRCLTERSQESQCFDMKRRSRRSGGRSYRVHWCCLHSGRHVPRWMVPGCPRKAWSGRHPCLSRMLSSERSGRGPHTRGQEVRKQRRKRGRIRWGRSSRSSMRPFNQFPRDTKIAGMISISRLSEMRDKSMIPVCPWAFNVGAESSVSLQLVALLNLSCFCGHSQGDPQYLLGGLARPLRRQEAQSKQQTPLQPLCVSCLPDGDQMKSSADDNKKRRDKGSVWMRPLHNGPSFLTRDSQ